LLQAGRKVAASAAFAQITRHMAQPMAWQLNFYHPKTKEKKNHTVFNIRDVKAGPKLECNSRAPCAETKYSNSIRLGYI